jgi:T5SS/PEP-CTERM-associated repeat protein
MKAHCFKRRHLGFVSGARLLGTVLLALAAGRAPAQFTANNQTITINSVVSNHTGRFRIGNGFYRDVLIVTNDGTLNVSSDAYLGGAAAWSNNLAVITGGNSLWSIATFFRVGYSGPRNRMTVADGATVRNINYGYIGSNPGGDFNDVLVTGAGSHWTNSSYLFVGSNESGAGGSNNTLTIAEGGRVSSGGGYVYVNGVNSGLLVTDSGSVFRAVDRLYAGTGAGGWTTVTNGGMLDVGKLYAGKVLITGTGSLARTSDIFTSGYSKQLTVADGARLSVGGVSYIGYGSASTTNNRVLITGSGSVWTGANFICIGYQGYDNHLVVSNGGAVYPPGWVYLGSYQTGASSNNSVLVTGTGSVLRSQSGGRVYVGYSGSGNRVKIAGGGLLDNGSANGALIGEGAAAYDNEVLVTGAGSIWSNGPIYLGRSGSGSRLTVADGGLVRNTTAYMGFYASASNSAAIVTGAGSVWSNSSILFVGYVSAGNLLTISDGGTVYAPDYSYLGSQQTGGSSGNDVLITGSNSALRITGTSNRRLFIGWSGANNRVTIRDGGLLDCGEGVVGYSAGGTQGRVRVEGPGSLWRNDGALTLGRAGGGNRLVIENGGAVESTTATIGSLSNNNAVFIGGSGSVWRTTGNLIVNDSTAGVGNGMIMSSGGVAVVAGTVTIKAGGYATNYVSGPPGGLDMTAAADSSLTATNLAIVFAGAPTELGPYWGLRWTGDHTNKLQTLKNAGQLTIGDSPALPAYWQNKARIFKDATYSYVGFDVTFIPEMRHGTLLLIR